MNLWGLIPNHENFNIFDGNPPRGSPRHGGQGFFELLLLIRRGGDPSGAAIIVHGECESLSSKRVFSSILV